MFDILKENYPYFGVNQRMHNMDWLAKRDEYEKRVRNAESDKDHYKVMSGILSELNKGHIRTFPTGKENTGIGWLN